MRLLLLLASLVHTGLWWCTGKALDSTPDFASEAERAQMLADQEKAAIRTRRDARERGKGPRVTEKLIEAAMLRVRDEAHDRMHRRQQSGYPAVEALEEDGVYETVKETQRERQRPAR